MIKHDFFLAKEWFLAHLNLGLWPDWQEYRAIRTAYSSEGRFYHTWQHIYETCSFVRLYHGFQPLVILALFYHDVVYDVKRKDNEEASARVWFEYAKKREIHLHNNLKMTLVSDLIVMTAKHHVEEDQPVAFKIMNDADMSIFFYPDDQYLEYARNIWREYHSFGREGFISGRLHFLSTVDPEAIYYTQQARALVHLARTNMELERTTLESNPDRILVAMPE